MAIGTRRHRLLTGADVGSLVRWTTANSTARLALLLTADDNGSLAVQTDDGSYHILADYATPTWVQLGATVTVISSDDAPTVNDDELDGYTVGSLWVRTNAGNEAFYCLADATAGAAVWVLAAGGGSSASWGSITGTLSAQTDLQAALDAAAAIGVTGDAYASSHESDATAHTDAEIVADVLGSPTHETVRKQLSIYHSAGVYTGGDITDDGDETITVAAGTGSIRATDDVNSPLMTLDWGAESGAGVALVDDDMNYIYVEYNGGTPQVVATTTRREDHHTNIWLGTVYKYTGTEMHITPNRFDVADHAGLMIERLLHTQGLTRESGALISETGTRNFALTASVWWLGLTHTSLAAYDTAAASTFTGFYMDGVGGWTEVTAQTQIDNTQYDDGDGTLGLLTGSRKGVHWAYVAQDGDLYVVYGTGNYTTGQADDATPPTSLPPHFQENHAALVGKITIQRNASSFFNIETPFTTVFAGSGVTSHSDLSDLGNDDHTQYLLADGTRAQDAALFTERADHVNTPGAGAAEVWLKDHAGTSALMLTDDAGLDSYIPRMIVPITNNAILVGSGSVGGKIDGNVLFAYNNVTGELALAEAAGSSLKMKEGAALAATPGAGFGYVWTKNTAPTTLWFTDDTGATTQLGAGGGGGATISLGTWTKGADTIGATAANSFDVDNATIASITAIRILASNPLGGARIDYFCANLEATGTLIMQDVSDPSANALIFDVTAHSLSASVYWDLTVSTLVDHGTNWATSYSVQFIPDAGAGGGFADAPDAALFDERADHVNTPAAGKAELWVKNDTDQRLMLTDDAGTDKYITHGPAVCSDNALVRFTGGKGQIQSLSTATLSDNTELFLSGIRAHVELQDRPLSSAAPTPVAGHGTYWVDEDTSPITPMFTPVTGTHLSLVRNTCIFTAYSTTLSTPVADTWYSWNDKQPYSDATWSDTYGTGTDPVGDYAMMWMVVPFDGEVTDLDAWIRYGSGSNNGYYAVYKSTPTDGADTIGTMTQLGSNMTAVGGGADDMDDVSQTGLSAAVSKGDYIAVFYRGDPTTPNSTGMRYQVTITIKETF